MQRSYEIGVLCNEAPVEFRKQYKEILKLNIELVDCVILNKQLKRLQYE